MIYVAPPVHRAIRQVALDEGRSASDVYVEAARTFLQGRGVDLVTDPEAPTAADAPSMAEIARAVHRQGERIEELHAVVAAASRAHPEGPQARAAVKTAEAMKVVLGFVRASGAAGISSGDLDAAARGAGVSSGSAEAAKAVLRGAKLVRFEGRRWYIE